MFNENEYKTMSKTIELAFIRNEVSFLNTWERTNFENQIASNYYKAELIRTIAIALNNGISEKDIIIFDESFKLNNNYSYVGNIDLNNINNVKQFYNLGVPISMLPNIDIIKINSLFKLYRAFNEYMYSVERFRLPIHTLSLYFDMLNSKSFESVANSLFEIALNEVTKLKLKNNVHEKYVKKLYSIKDKAIAVVKKYDDDIIYVGVLEEKLSKGIYKFEEWDNSPELYAEVEKNYFNKFYSKFNELSRPIVGIYYHNEQVVQILCSSFINKGKKNDAELDFVETKHINPLGTLVKSGLSIADFVLEQKRKEEEHKQNMSMLRKEDKYKEQEHEMKMKILEARHILYLQEVKKNEVIDVTPKRIGMNNETYILTDSHDEKAVMSTGYQKIDNIPYNKVSKINEKSIAADYEISKYDEVKREFITQIEQVNDNSETQALSKVENQYSRDNLEKARINAACKMYEVAKKNKLMVDYSKSRIIDKKG